MERGNERWYRKGKNNRKVGAELVEGRKKEREREISRDR